MIRQTTSGALIWLVAAAVAGAQHTGHQMPGQPAAPPDAQLVDTCVKSQQRAAATATRLDRRLETARQTNSAAEMRAAMDDLQAGLVELQATLRACDPLKAPAAPDPHAGHGAATVKQTPPVAPGTAEMQPGAPKPAPGAVQPRAPLPLGEALDPVCRVKVDPKTAPKAYHQGKTYYFCSESDRQLFVKDPAKYIKKEAG